MIGIGVIAAVVVYYLLLWVTPPCCLLAFLALVVFGALWLERAVVNFGRNDSVAQELFGYFGAPEILGAGRIPNSS